MSELSSTNGSEAVQADGLGAGALLEPEEAWAGMNEQARKRTTTILSGKEKADVVRTIAVSENAIRDREIVFGKPTRCRDYERAVQRWEKSSLTSTRRGRS
jgi:hypothetical protein